MLFAAGDAAATPTVWAKARSPELARESAALDFADRELARWMAEDLETRNGFGIAPPEDAKRVHDFRVKEALEKAGGEKSRNPGFLARYAAILHSVGDDVRSLRLDRRIIASDALPSFKAQAFYNLAVSLAHLGKVDDEIATYERALAFEPEGEGRALVFANQAEAYMVSGDVSRAVSGYRAAIASHEVLPTAYWGLGVALDRSGDLDGALDSIALARAYDPNDRALQPPNWFFVPEYDSAWYAALGELLVARTAKRKLVSHSEGSAEQAQSFRDGAYHQAIEDWRDYIARAGDKDPYVAVARARLKRTEKELKDFMAETWQNRKQKHGADDREPEESLSIHPLPLPH